MVIRLCFLLFFCSVFIIICQGNHFFIILLSFEVLTLRLYIFSVRGIFNFRNFISFFLCVVFLVFRVCEARIGLGLLVRSVGVRGDDSLSNTIRIKF